MLILLIILLILLAFLGAGIFAPTLLITSTFLCGSALILSLQKKQTTVNSLLPGIAAALIVVLVITALPLPAPISGMLSTHRAALNSIAAETILVAAETDLIDEFTPFFSISRNRSGTIRIILLLICIFTCAALTSQFDQKKRLLFVRVLVLFGVILAVGGFISQWILPQGKSIWWILKINHGSPVGCFINRNHFGGYLTMLAPAALIFAVSEFECKKWFRCLVFASAFVVISFAIISSLSRGAWLAWLFSLLVTSVVLTHKAKTRRLITALACIIAICSAVALGLSSSKKEVSERLNTFENLAETPSANMRFTTWKDASKIIPDYPLLGTGANGFRMLFPQYRTSSSRKEFKHVENEYIQIPVELGLIGTVLLATIFIIIFMRWRSAGDSDSRDESMINACILGALTAVAIHALFDFCIRVPLYAITLAAITGLAIKPAIPQKCEKTSKATPLFIYYTGGLIIIAVIFFAGGHEATKMDSSDHIEKASARQLCKALTYSPSSWQIWYHLGNRAIASGLPGSYELGEKFITQATIYDPLNYRLLKQLCLVRLHQNDIIGAKEAYRELKALRSWVKIHELE